MDALISLLLLILVIWWFGDVFVSFLWRFISFFVCMWIAMAIYHRLAQIVIEMGFVEHQPWAGVISFVVVFGICWSLLRCIGVRVDCGAVGDGEAVALDGFRIGLVCAICLAIFMMLAALTSGQLLFVSWVFLCVIAVGVAGLDVCAPSVMGRAAKWFD